MSENWLSDVTVINETNYPIPDDHIAPSRSSLFLARSVLRGIRNGGYDANQAA